MEDVVANLEVLAEQLRTDFPIEPNALQGPGKTVNYEPLHSTTDFAGESAGYGEAAENLKATVTMISQMNDLVDLGAEHLGNIYASRSCTAKEGIPQVKAGADKEHNEAHHAMTVEVLAPVVKKMKACRKYHEEANRYFVKVVKTLAIGVVKKSKNCTVLTTPLLDAMARLLDMLLTMDVVKNNKPGWQNDFSAYKRAAPPNSNEEEKEMMEQYELQKFLGSPFAITHNLKAAIHDVPNYDFILAAIVNHCQDLYERGEKRGTSHATAGYIQPQEKRMVIKILAYGILLLDSTQFPVTKNKRIQLDKVLRILKGSPVVLLLGDIPFSVKNVLMSSQSISTSFLESEDDEDKQKLTAKYSLLKRLDHTRKQYREYMARTTILRCDLLQVKENPHREKELLGGTDFVSLFTEGMTLISSWTGRILEMSAWKSKNPADKFSNVEVPDDATAYELAVRYNYNNEELFGLTELLSQIKSLSGMLTELYDGGIGFVRGRMHGEFQTFILKGMDGALQHTLRKKKGSSRLLQLVQMIGSDRPESGVYTATGEKPSLKSKGSSADIRIHHRNAAPSSTLVMMVVMLLELIYNGSEKGGGNKKDLTASEITAMKEFVERIKLYSYMLEMPRVLRENADLSDLWYKEFYLEISKVVQFPIEMSLPWMMTSALLQSSSMVEYILFPFELYNDSANRALHYLKSKFLYDEVEAEVNLCFDQLAFILSRKVYTIYKTHAAGLLLDSEVSKALIQTEGVENVLPGLGRIEVFLTQHSVTMLGRSVDLAQIITEHLNALFRKSLDVAISRFEGSDLLGITELKVLFDVTRLAHHMLSEKLQLDPFEQMLAEANEDTSATSNNSRINTHLICELIADICPNYCYHTSRNAFAKAPLILSEEIKREQVRKAAPMDLFGNKILTAAYLQIFKQERTTFTIEHVNNIITIVGKDKAVVLIEEVVANVKSQFINAIRPYVDSLQGGLSPSINQPLFTYGAAGAFGYYEAILKPILTYGELKTEVFHYFRQMGNLFALVSMFDNVVEQYTLRTAVTAAPFLTFPEGISTFKTMSTEEHTMGFSKTVDKICRNFDTAQDLASTMVERGKVATEAYKPNFARGGLLSMVIKSLDELLTSTDLRDVWRGAVPLNNILNIDDTSEFFNLWSVLQFSFCTPGFKNEHTAAQLFGDGLNWAGLTIIHLLGQRPQFEMFDYSYYTCCVISNDNKHGQHVGAVSMEAFVQYTEYYRDINAIVFAALEKSSRLLASQETTPPQLLYGVCHPPKNAQCAATYMPFEGEHGTGKSRRIEQRAAGK